jgi:hypothetical protein
MIKRIKQMNKGMFRLLVCLYPVSVLLAFVMTPAFLDKLGGMVGNASHKMSVLDSVNAYFLGDSKLFFNGCIIAVLSALVYWPFVRMWLWIYDGFLSSKQTEKK